MIVIERCYLESDFFFFFFLIWLIDTSYNIRSSVLHHRSSGKSTSLNTNHIEIGFMLVKLWSKDPCNHLQDINEEVSINNFSRIQGEVNE